MGHFNFRRQINKPEYWLRPSQVLKRLRYRSQQLKETAVDVDGTGKNFFVNETETIGHSLLTMGVYDLVVGEAIHRILKKGDLFLDIGANIGYFTRLACQFGAKTMAFEAHPDVFKRLKKNTTDLRHCEVFQQAISDSEDTMDLFIPESFESNEGIASLEPQQNSKKIKVSSITLDSVIDSPISLMKLDIEGHEHRALLGCRRLFEQNKIKAVIFEDFNGKQSQTIALLENAGFKIKRLKKSLFGPKLVSYKDENDIPSWEPINYLAYKDELKIESIFSKKGWNLLKNIG